MKWSMRSDGMYGQKVSVILEAATPLKAVKNWHRGHSVKRIGPGLIYEVTVGFIKNTVYLKKV